MASKDIEEGPLSQSDQSQEELKGEISGLPTEYLLGESSHQTEQRFYNLQAEDTLSSLEASDLHQPQASSTAVSEASLGDLRQRRKDLHLDIDESQRESSTTNLIFSPGGTEAYVFSTAGLSQEELHHATDASRKKSKKQPRGERPLTVGHADDSPKPPRMIDRNMLQGRLEVLRTSLDFEHDEQSSAQPSTEPSPRRYLPRVPLGLPEQDDEESMASPSITRRGAMSPSLASVASGSTTASGTDALRRRNLEWDSGADLGYDGAVKQKEAAASLSTLEKLAIGNYSNFLRTEPEGKPTAKGGNLGRGQPMLNPNSLPGGQDHEDKLRQLRLHKFADSLMKQRQYAHQQHAASATSNQSKDATSSSLASGVGPTMVTSAASTTTAQTLEAHVVSNKKKSKSDTSQDGSPMRRKPKKKSSPRRTSGRSSSLTDLPHELHHQLTDIITGTHSASDLSPRSFIQHQSTAHTDPSSSSSTTTVVPHHVQIEDEEIDPRILEALSTDPSSLPVEFYGALSRGGHHHGHLRSQQSQTSLNSRQSMETVISLEQLLARQQKKATRKSSTAATRQRLPESDSLDTEDEIQMIKEQQQPSSSSRSAYFESRNDAEGSEANSERSKPFQQQAPAQVRQFNNWMLRDDLRAQSLPPPSSSSLTKDQGKSERKEQKAQIASRRRPPADTTSEDERQKDKRSGTLDSAPIDRAKSFEYFPGESFPLQENSSSYEYLPGHMIHDTRPPTVVSNRPVGGSSSSNLSPTTSPSVQSTSSNAVVSSSKKKRTRGHGHLVNDPSKLAYHLMEKTNQLHSAHVHQTMTFYNQLKERISYASKPSQSPAEARIKQQLIDKILDLMKQEEVKLSEKRPLSSQLGVPPDSDEATEPTTRKIGGSVDEADADVTNPTNISVRDDEDSSLQERKRQIDVTIAELRSAQLRKIRKELRKLEKLDRMGMRKAADKTEADVIRQIMALSDDSSVTTRSSSVVPSVDVPVQTASSQYRGIEGQSASGSDNKKTSTSGHMVVPELASKKSTNSKRKPSVASVKEFCPKELVGSSKRKDVKTNTYNVSSSPPPLPPPPVTMMVDKSSREKEVTMTSQALPSMCGSKNADFGQTFPTPRDSGEKQFPPEKKAHRSNDKIRTSSKSLSSSKAVQKAPLSYYLPLGQESVIKGGVRKVREQRKAHNNGGGSGKENSNILANYLASIESSSTSAARVIRPKTAPQLQPSSHNKEEEVANSTRDPISLQDALLLKKPDFVRKSEWRVEVLRQIRTQRLDQAEKYKLWLEEVSKLPPKSRALLAPPSLPKAPRLFSYREMVREAREKYQKLPEIVYCQAEAKRKRSYRTNRLKADMYKTKLQRKVLQGRVSLAHHNQILNQ